MKEVFSIILSLFILPFILSSELSYKTNNLTMKNFKLIQKSIYSPEIEDLFLSDSSIDISDSISINDLDPKEEAYDVEENNTSINFMPSESNSTAILQIKKFFNFEGNKENRKIKYNLFLLFFGTPIAQTIYIRLIIYYQRELTNTQSIPYIVIQSAPSICIIKDGYKDKIGTNGNLDNIIYNCESTINYMKLNVTRVTLDSSYDILADDEKISFDDVNFDSDAAEEALNIVKTLSYIKFGSLDNAQVELPIQRNYIRINGTLNPEDLLSQGNIIPMEIINYDDEEVYKFININCTAIKVNKPNCVLECDTENQTIKCMTSNFSIAKSLLPNCYLKINMNQEEMEIETPIQIIKEINNKKSSGGLSKGAIAGIVIACIVVLGVILIVIIIRCQKTPPIPPTNPLHGNIKTPTETSIKTFNQDIKTYNPKIVDIKQCDPKIKLDDEKNYKGNDNKVWFLLKFNDNNEDICFISIHIIKSYIKIKKIIKNIIYNI